MVEAGKAGVPVKLVGRFGGDTVQLGSKTAPLEELRAIYRGAFEAALG